jgi:hypothetical protein
MGPDVACAPPVAPLTLSVPAIVTSPVARIVTGVLALFGVTVTVTPAGTFIVVKLKTPVGGSASVVVAVGAKGPSSPVLPLLKVWAAAVEAQRRARATCAPPVSHRRIRFVVMVDSCRDKSLTAYGADTLAGGATLMLLPEGATCAG